MGLDLPTVEGIAVGLYERLGFDPSEPRSTFKLATAWLGEGGVERPATMTVPSMKGRRGRGPFIAVRRSVPTTYARFYAGHELGHLLLEEAGFVGEDEEQVADAIGAALMAPVPAVRRMHRVFGSDFAQLADIVCSTQTWAALRLAETLGIPRAVITPQRLYVRGPESFVWGDECDLRRVARRGRPGITKARLTDDPRRVVLDIDDLDAATS